MEKFKVYPRAAILLLGLSAHAGAQTLQAGSLSLSQAIEFTLREHPLLLIQKEQVQYARGALLRSQSQFDRVVQSGVSVGRTYQPLDEVERTLYDAVSATTNTSSLNAGVTQEFQNGVTVTPSLNITRTTDNIATQFGINQSHLGVQVNVPLLRGRGKEVVTAPEKASGVEIEASLSDLKQTMSDLVYNTAVSYWSTVAARRSLDVYREAEMRGRILLETVEALIAADRIPRSDESEVQANLADRTALRIAADQQLLEAKQQLGIAMGLGAEEVFVAPDPGDPLPAASGGGLPRERVPAIIAEALTRREDYLAAKKRQGEAEILAGAARNRLKPQLDLQFSTGYSGLKEGTNSLQPAISPFTGVHGIDAIGGIQYTFPLQNRAAEAGVIQSRSNLMQAGYRSQDLARNIASSVVVTAEGVRSAIEQLRKVNESAVYFNTALDNEREKYRLGVGSLVELLTVEDRLTGVLTAQVQAELGYAVALARLRQATGTIVDPDKNIARVDPSVLVTLPGAP
jgi:outer membrane protein TolC